MEILADEGSRFIPLVSDYGFKATFGNEHNTLFLRRALQALIKSAVPIREVTFLPNEQARLSADSRGGIYDLACVDERGSYFIVEMQLAEYPEFVQRMKFYALHRFNTLARKGNDYAFQDMPRIYCIAILATNIFAHVAAYHNVATFRNETGEPIDDQLTLVTVELAKFDKSAATSTSDLDKLLFTMKTLHTTAPDPTQWPAFWTEDWIQLAIHEVDKLALPPEELLNYYMTLSKNALIVRNEKLKIAAAEKAVTAAAVKKALLRGKLSAAEIADDHDVTAEFVAEIRRQLLAE